MAARTVWAWQALVVSGGIAFGRFLLTSERVIWTHGTGSRPFSSYPSSLLRCGAQSHKGPEAHEISNSAVERENKFEILGRRLLGACAAGLVLAGATIAIFGMTTVFVPSDLAFIGLDPPRLQKISPMLIPLISHDRAGFGGGLCSIGAFLLFVARHADNTRSLAQIVVLMGCVGFGCAIGVHFAVGYTDFLHLLPAFVGFALFVVVAGLLWAGRDAARRSMIGGTAMDQ